ncbi:MAG: spinster family MFS transporter [bacterium]
MPTRSDQESGQSLEVPKNRWSAFSLLFVIYVFNFVDRSLLGILAEAIKRDLDFSDTQLGFLTGIAFAIFYTIMGLPLARLADRWVRKNLLVLCLLAWSAMTMLSGFAQTYTQLVIARIGVAVGEAGATPTSHSMISDLFPPEERTSALSLYSGATTVGWVVGLLLGGIVAENYGWRAAFIAAGAPGILLAFVTYFFLDEPVRGGADSAADRTEAAATEGAPSIREIIQHLFVDSPSFRYMALAASLHNFTSVGIWTWLPPFLARTHGLSLSEIGIWLAALSMGGSFVGVVAGGILAERLAKHDPRWLVWLPAIAAVVAIPFACFTFLYDDYRLALAAYLIPAIMGSVYLGPAFGLAQNLVGPRMRAFASTVLLFMGVLIGQGLGPQVVGILSDWFREDPAIGDDSLRYALLAALSMSLVAVVFYLLAARHITRDLEKVGFGSRPPDSLG